MDPVEAQVCSLGRPRVVQSRLQHSDYSVKLFTIRSIKPVVNKLLIAWINVLLLTLSNGKMTSPYPGHTVEDNPLA